MFIGFLTKSVRIIPSDHQPTEIVFCKPLSSVTRWFYIYTLVQCCTDQWHCNVASCLG